MMDHAAVAPCPSQPRWRPRRRWKRLAAAVGILSLLLWLGGSYLVAKELTRRTRSQRPEPKLEVAGLLYEDVRLSTSDGEDLGAWFFEGQSDQPAVVLLHGKGATRRSMLAQAQWLVAAGHPVLAVTQRAHGDSSGQFVDAGFSARHDVVAAVEWLEQRCPDQPIVVWGQSLGGAAALFASEDLGERVDGYILECVYADLRQAVWNRLERQLPPVVSHVSYAGLMTVTPLVLPNLNDLSPANAARRMPLGIPVLLLAGGNDVRVRREETQSIASSLGDRAGMVVIDGADHLGLWDADRQRVSGAVEGFLARIPRQ